MVGAVVPEFDDDAARDFPDWNRSGAPGLLFLCDRSSVRLLERRRLYAVIAGAAKQGSLGAIDLLLFTAPRGSGSLSTSLFLLLRRLHGGLADVPGEMDRAGRADILRLPQPVLTYGVDWILASLLFILCPAPVGRALSLDRVRAVRAAKAGNIEATVAALQQRLGRRLHRG